MERNMEDLSRGEVWLDCGGSEGVVVVILIMVVKEP